MSVSSDRKVYPEALGGPMALPIVMLRDRNQHLSHEKCLLASFLHMEHIMAESQNGNWEYWREPFNIWRKGKFRKIVKRANPQRYEKMVEENDAISTNVRLGDELIELMSFPPYLMSDQDRRVKPLQVSGLDYDTEGLFYNGNSEKSSTLVLAYDGKLGASTGKMMAQAAHGAQILKMIEPAWSSSNESIQVRDSFEGDKIEWLVNVVDAGFTEIAPNSNTVRIGRMKE